MALEQNRGSRKPHGELLKEKTEKAKEIEAGKRASYIVTLPEEKREEKKETKRKIDNLDVLQMNTARDIEGELDEVYSKKEKRKKSLWKKILLLSVIEILTLVMIVCAGYVVRYMNIKPEVQFNIKNVKNQNIDVTKQEQMQGYWTIAVFGVDSRDGGVGRGANADVQLIVCIDRATGAVKLASVFRDTYLNLAAGSRFAKINEAYADGGPEQAVAALNKNLDLDIEHYATFNWRAVADVITMLGGVDIDITEKEFKYMNAYIHETSIESKVNVKNPAAEYIKKPGMQHLDGVQAVAYARLRYMDDDFTRTKRQREVISQVLDKAKKADLATLTNVIDTVLPQIAFNVDVGDILELAKGVNKYNIVGSEGFPYDLRTQMMGKKGDCVIPLSLASNVTKLHEYLFGDENYKPSSAVWTFSDKIASDAQSYKNGGGEESSKKKSKHSDDEDEETKKSETKKKKGESESESESESKKKKAETDADGNLIETTKSSGSKKETEESKSGKSTEESKSQGPTSETKTTSEETKKNSEESKKSETASQEPSIGKGPDEATGSDDNGPGNIVE
ncbi:LCP family protein [Oribacterium sp. oral taxon 108]|uniref:LCP family protein n=1 Tax=Oribacterium sp. oral taxon 108 TaxID=712414 RepID=UPI00020DDC12|nr:LCP family protein [Oribacterium sp. oral taxon 108]EGL37150.1 cell envelope-like function transcriptional attenuator common domain protein [Oribacterium sp. oral taxon 108 str. F0425]